MDGATLTINFRDDSTGTPQSPAATPQQGGVSNPVAGLVDSQQQQITQARSQQGQVTQSASASVPPAASVVSVPVSAPIPTPAITTASTSMPTGDAALAANVRSIAAADPRATAEEIAKLLGGGLTANQVRGMLGGSSPPPPTSSTPPVTPPTAPPVASTVDSLVADTRKLWDRDLAASTADMWEKEGREASRTASTSAATSTKPYDDIDLLIRRNKRIAAETQSSLNEEDNRRKNEREHDSRIASGVQSSLGQITALASQFGRVPGAIAGAVTSTMAIPGVASALGSAAPMIASAAPFIAAATAGIGIPLAAGSVIEGIQRQAASQIGGLSGPVTIANAQAEVRQLMANLRTSERIGSEVAKGVAISSVARAARQEARDTGGGFFLDSWNSIKYVFTGLTIGLQQNLAAITGNTEQMKHLMNLQKELYEATKGLDPNQSYGLFQIVPKRPKLPPPFSGQEEGGFNINKGSKPGL